MRHSYRPDIPPKPQPYRTLVLDHLGLVAGMFEELGITEVIDKATQQDPAMRIVTAGHAVKAMVLNGLGLPQPEPTNGTGSTKQWWPCTPAMAAGLTDHVWTLREVLLYRVPPWPRPQAL